MSEQFTGLRFELFWAIVVEAVVANWTAIETNLGIMACGLPAVSAGKGLSGMIVRIE